MFFWWHVFFFKQKTAYEMRISDWSSDVCSSDLAVHRAPLDNPSSKEGAVLTVEFTVLGIPCVGLNGGPVFQHSEAFSFQVHTDSQQETDRYWNAIVGNRSEEHTSELQSLMRISYAVFCLKK